jgi:hypothetical protein
MKRERDNHSTILKNEQQETSIQDWIVVNKRVSIIQKSEIFQGILKRNSIPIKPLHTSSNQSDN